MGENKFSTACLIVGILSCVLCCACLGFPLGIAGIVLFVLSASGGSVIDTKAGFGLALSILGIILSIIMLLFLIIAGSQDDNGRYNFSDYYNYYDYNDDNNLDDFDGYFDDYDNDLDFYFNDDEGDVF